MMLYRLVQCAHQLDGSLASLCIAMRVDLHGPPARDLSARLPDTFTLISATASGTSDPASTVVDESG